MLCLRLFVVGAGRPGEGWRGLDEDDDDDDDSYDYEYEL